MILANKTSQQSGRLKQSVSKNITEITLPFLDIRSVISPSFQKFNGDSSLMDSKYQLNLPKAQTPEEFQINYESLRFELAKRSFLNQTLSSRERETLVHLERNKSELANLKASDDILELPKIIAALKGQ